MKKLWVLGMGLILAFAGIAHAEDVYKFGSKVESLQLKGVDGETVAVELDGDPTAVVFFNSACSACRAEMAHLGKLMRKEKGLKVVAVCTDVNGAAGVERFKRSTKLDAFEYYLDPEFEVAGKFGFSYTPALALVDKSGKLYYAKGGWRGADADVITKKVSEKK